jgi:hypothetical protein
LSVEKYIFLISVKHSDEEIQQLLNRLDAMLSNVAPPSTTSNQPLAKELWTILKAFLLLKSWLE